MVSKIETDQTAIAPDISHLTIEDETPLNNFQSEKQQRLLTNSRFAHSLVSVGWAKI